MGWEEEKGELKWQNTRQLQKMSPPHPPGPWYGLFEPGAGRLYSLGWWKGTGLLADDKGCLKEAGLGGEWAVKPGELEFLPASWVTLGA